MLLAPMARQPVSKALWKQLQPLVPAFTPSAKGGARKLGVSDEASLNGIHPIRASHWYPMGRPASRLGLRQRYGGCSGS